MSERIMKTGEHPELTPEASSASQGELGKITILEALAEPVEFISPNRSNASTPPRNTDFDDQ